MVGLCTALYCRTSCGYKDVVEILNVMNEFAGNIYGEVPSYTTIRNWCLELGYDIFKATPPTLKGTKYAIVMDESMMIGGVKLLLFLAIPAYSLGRPIKEQDAKVVDIQVASGWNTDAKKKALQRVLKKIGSDPVFVISDNESALCNGIRLAGQNHHRDISHSMGMFLERVYKNDPDFLAFIGDMRDNQLKFNMNVAAYLQPPKQRAIARFMNFFNWVDWAQKISSAFHLLNNKEQEIYGFIPQHSKLIKELSEVMECYRLVESEIKNKGLSRETESHCKMLVHDYLEEGSDRMKRVGEQVKEYLEKETCLLANDTESHNCSSDCIESIFGVYKSRKSPNKLYGVGPIILTLPLRANLMGPVGYLNFDFKKGLEATKHSDVTNWLIDNLPANKVTLRHNILNKKSA